MRVGAESRSAPIDSAKGWDNLGMLQYAIQLEQSGQIEYRSEG